MLNGSTVFTQIISAPLVQLPVMLASAIDAFVALRRIGTFMRAEELAVPYEIDPHAEAAVDVDGDFTWETVRKDASNAVSLGAKIDKGGKGRTRDRGKGKKEKKKGGKKKGDESLLSTAATTPAGASTPVGSAENGASGEGGEERKEKEEKPFELIDLKLKISRGSFVAIVGRVGSGKVRRSCIVLCLYRG